MANIILECKPDEVLIKTLGFTRKDVIHQPNKGSVFNFLKKNPGNIGVVDEDPGAANPAYFSVFQKSGEEAHNVVCYKVPRYETLLIVLKPRLEEWVLHQAKSVSVNPKDFSLPVDGHSLHKVINSKLSKFQEMLMELLDKKCKGLQHLKELMKTR